MGRGEEGAHDHIKGGGLNTENRARGKTQMKIKYEKKCKGKVAWKGEVEKKNRI